MPAMRRGVRKTSRWPAPSNSPARGDFLPLDPAPEEPEPRLRGSGSSGEGSKGEHPWRWGARGEAAPHPDSFQKRSRTISRVLCPTLSGRATVIPLGRPLPAASSNLPGDNWPGRPASLFGLAPDGVCLADRVAAVAGGLLPHRFTLTGWPEGRPAVCFLLRFPGVAPPGSCPASCPVEPGLSSPPLAGRGDGPSNSEFCYLVSFSSSIFGVCSIQ